MRSVLRIPARALRVEQRGVALAPRKRQTPIDPFAAPQRIEIGRLAGRGNGGAGTGGEIEVAPPERDVELGDREPRHDVGVGVTLHERARAPLCSFVLVGVPSRDPEAEGKPAPEAVRR